MKKLNILPQPQSKNKQNKEAAQDQLVRLQMENDRLKAKLDWYEEQYRLSKQKQFDAYFCF
jgi:predicted nuclease with TOPRIM domain